MSRRLQFSLRALLVVTAVASLALGWLVAPLVEFHRQRQIANELRERGMGIERESDEQDSQMVYRGNQPKKPPPGPAWGRRLYGDDFFVNVIGVTWRGEPPGDADFRLLAGLRHLKRLSLAHTSLDDASLSGLALLDQVRELDLRATKLTDAGLGRFPPLPNLERVYLAKTKVTDRGVVTLRRRVNPFTSISW